MASQGTDPSNDHPVPDNVALTANQSKKRITADELSKRLEFAKKQHRLRQPGVLAVPAGGGPQLGSSSSLDERRLYDGDYPHRQSSNSDPQNPQTSNPYLILPLGFSLRSASPSAGYGSHVSTRPTVPTSSRSTRKDYPLSLPQASGPRKLTPTESRAKGRRYTEGYQRDNASAKQAGTSSLPSSRATRPPAPRLLNVSNDVLGYGSQGTVVYEGTFQGRPVAVKRVVKDFVSIVEREIRILEASDHHSNVIRYYCREEHAGFHFIALDLCPATLADIVECPNDFHHIMVAFEPKHALKQITCGLQHLHTLNIIHRDIKPHNILVSPPRKGANGSIFHNMLISDFGLCKKLADDETSYVQSTANAGTAGWRAPEVIDGKVKIGGSVDAASSETTGRLRKSVDIFPLGCVYYYVLTCGGHPFGVYLRRDGNIVDDIKSLQGLERHEEEVEAASLISRMLSPIASDRPDTSTCLLHPFFWSPARRLDFLQAASDWFEQFRRFPNDPQLVELESGATDVVGNDWTAALDKDFVANLGSHRRSGYNGGSVGDLIRVVRNKKHHYHDLPPHVKAQVGPIPEGFLSYFTRRFPRLIMYVYDAVSKLSATEEDAFRSYYRTIE